MGLWAACRPVFRLWIGITNISSQGRLVALQTSLWDHGICTCLSSVVVCHVSSCYRGSVFFPLWAGAPHADPCHACLCKSV